MDTKIQYSMSFMLLQNQLKLDNLLQTTSYFSYITVVTIVLALSVPILYLFSPYTQVYPLIKNYKQFLYHS